MKFTRSMSVAAALVLGASASYARLAEVWQIPAPLGTTDQPIRLVPRPQAFPRLCGQVFYGTGYHGCGTATGGPVGGLPSRN